MPVTPEDLVEAWHLVVADGAEPKLWKMSESLWLKVRKAAEQREHIDAGDPLPSEEERTLLGTPIEIVPDEGLAPVLRIRRNGQDESVPIVGSVDELE
ncbi:MAG TPA: hypothetical protein VFJ46_17755 [Xanthobacteraceae bacterium]|nr:hypothetical protein [Xanthobacteraceae bacterium]